MNPLPKSVLRLVRQVRDDDLRRVHRSCGAIERCGGCHAGAVLDLAAATRGPGGGPIAGRGLLDEIVSRPGRLVTAWLARADMVSNRAIGLVTLVAAGPAGAERHSIGWLLVEPGHRRQGVGTDLVRAALAEAARAGATDVWVETHAAWPAAAAFWQRLGFMPR